MTQETDQAWAALLHARFGDAPERDAPIDVPALVTSMVKRGSCREFRHDTIPDEWLDVLCAVALSSPTKSDLQQRDVILLKSPEQRAHIAACVPDQDWVAEAPLIAVFCGNNRRQRQLHEWHNVPFANDHLDAFFNATGDAAIALGAFVTAAEAIGLGCCPISGIRNNADKVADILNLPDYVFPFAGLGLGFPQKAPEISPRLPLAVTCHVDQFNEGNVLSAVDAYDQRRAQTQPYVKQRLVEEFGNSQTYGWSEDKVRQYSRKEREGFGAFIRAIGFKLD